jgi:hypothetical protein
MQQDKFFALRHVVRRRHHDTGRPEEDKMGQQRHSRLDPTIRDRFFAMQQAEAKTSLFSLRDRHLYRTVT